MDKVILDHHHQGITIITIIITVENYRHLVPYHIVRTDTYILSNADPSRHRLTIPLPAIPFSYLH